MTSELKKLLQEELAKLTKEMFDKQDEINYFEEVIQSRNIELFHIGQRIQELEKILNGKKKVVH